MTRDFEPFFTLAGTFGVTLWVVTIALLTIVLTSTRVGTELGLLSLGTQKALSLTVSLQLSNEMRATLDALFGQYRALWFVVEVLPITVYFQVAMLLSLCVLIPSLPLAWLFIVPMVHVLVWTVFIVFLKRNQHRLEVTMKEGGLETNGKEKLPDTRFISMRITLWELPLLLFSMLILWLPWPIWVVLVSVLVCIIAGMAQALRVTANIIVARS